jgi:uncharacterized membrane protein
MSAVHRMHNLMGGTDEQWATVNVLHDESMGLGQRVADGVARNVGSWRFILTQSFLLACWLFANAYLVFHNFEVSGFNFKAWDPYPFILLNLMLSFQAAYTAPFILMSQNRQADKDRVAAEHDFHINISAEARVRAILEHLKAQDDCILSVLRRLEALHGIGPDAAQMAAEESLRSVVRREAELVSRTVKSEEKAAGIDDGPGAT